MLNKLRTAVLSTISIAATLLGGSQAWALTADTVIDAYSTINIGSCPVIFAAHPNEDMRILLGFNHEVQPLWGGGSIGGAALGSWGLNGPSGGQPAITEAQFSQCGIVGAENFQLDAANDTFATDDYFGFTVEGIDPESGERSRWEFAFSGADSTKRIETRTCLSCDVTMPTIAITSDVASLAAGKTAAITFTLSEASTDFVESDVTVTGGALSGFAGSGTSYTATFTPDAGSTANGVISVASGVFTDAAGNANADGADADNTVTLAVDTGLPTVILSGAPETLTNLNSFTVTATFDKDVTGFDDLLNDVIVTNGTVTAITGGPAVYTLTVTPTGAGDVSITVPAAAAQDAAANDNTASNTLVIGNQIVEITQEAIAGFMLGRANNLASNQPGLTRFLQGDGCGAFSANATEGSGSINGCVSSGNAWASLTSSWSGNDNYTLGTIGAHTVVNQNLLIGGMFQYDYAEDNANNASGTGYMVGPYFVAKLPEQPLFFEGRLLYGKTDNKISPLGTYTDSFETERWLAQLRATGEYKYNATTLMPLLDFTYTDDTQKAYIDSLGNTIPGQTVSLMQFTAGMDFSTPIPVARGSLDLTGGLSGIYSATNGGAAAPEFENWRGRTHLGLNYGMANGANLSATTFYDGIGTDYESYGVSLGFDWKF